MTFCLLPDAPETLPLLTPAETAEFEQKHPSFPKTPRAGCLTCNQQGWSDEAGAYTLLWYPHGQRGVEPVRWACNCRAQWRLGRKFLMCGIKNSLQRLSWSDYYDDALAEHHRDLALRYLSNLDRYLGQGIGMVLYGRGRGTGKTMFSGLLAKAVVGQGRHVYMSTQSAILDAYSGSWTDQQARVNFDRRVRGVELLVIDDLGREYAGRRDFSSAGLEDLLRFRVQGSLATIITTNETPSDLRQHYGEHTMSVLSETTMEVELDGPDRRPQVNARLMDEIERGLSRPVVIR